MARRSRNGTRPGSWIRPARRLAIYLRDDFRCLYCERDLFDARPHEITLDHLEPVSCGGTHKSANLVTACNSCNASRKATAWRTFAATARSGRALWLIGVVRRRTVPLRLAKAILTADANLRLERRRAAA